MWPASDSLLARRYRLDDRIAAGGFGEVWRGSDTVLARPVAIKLLHPHAAHLAGVVHRDIKPGNLLLAPGSQVKITDFGISHSIGSAPVTSTGMLLGTAGYLAPEQVAGRRATSKSDLYSLGVVAHECLAGTPPFAGTQLEVALAHRDRPLPPLPATVPDEVAALVDQLTAKDPAQRPDSAGVVASQAARLRDRLAGADHQAGGWPAARVTAPAGTTPGPAAAGNWSPDLAAGNWSPDLAAGGDWTPGAPAVGSPTLLGPAPGHLPGPDELVPGRPPRGGRRTGRVAALAAAAVVVALTGWVLVSWLGAARQPQAATAGRSAPSLSTAKMVHVRTDALIGRPVTAVTRQLHQLGLVVHVRWQPSPQQAPGLVISVRPGGWIRSGSAVTVTRVLGTRAGQAKASPHGHGKGHPHGHGHGQGHGRGTAAAQARSPSPGTSSTPSPSAGSTPPAGASPPATPSPSATPTNQPTPGPSPTTSTAAGQ